MLTKRQYQLLMLIEKRLREDGVSPSFEEMKESIGLKSKSGRLYRPEIWSTDRRLGPYRV